MRRLLILSAAVAALTAPAFAQSSPPVPVLPAPREYTNPNENMQPMYNNVAPFFGGRAAAPRAHPARNGGARAPARSGAKGS